MEIRSKDPEFYYKIGTTHFDKGDDDQAILYFNKALEINPNYAKPYFSRSQVFSKKKEYDQAIDEYNKVIGINSRFAGVGPSLRIHRPHLYHVLARNDPWGRASSDDKGLLA